MTVIAFSVINYHSNFDTLLTLADQLIDSEKFMKCVRNVFGVYAVWAISAFRKPDRSVRWKRASVAGLGCSSGSSRRQLHGGFQADSFDFAQAVVGGGGRRPFPFGFVVGQCYACVVMGIAAVLLFEELTESNSHPDVFFHLCLRCFFRKYYICCLFLGRYVPMYVFFYFLTF